MKLRDVGRNDVPLSFLNEVRPYAEHIDSVMILNMLFQARGVLVDGKYNTAQSNQPIIKDICSKPDLQSYLKAYRVSININENNNDYVKKKKCGHINNLRYSKQIRSYKEDDDFTETNLSPFSQSFSPGNKRTRRVDRAPRLPDAANLPDAADLPDDDVANLFADYDGNDLNYAEIGGGADADGGQATVCSGLNAAEPIDSMVRRVDALLQCVYGNKRDTTGLRATRPIMSGSNVHMIFQPCVPSRASEDGYAYELTTSIGEIARKLKNPDYVVSDANITSLLRPLQKLCKEAIDLGNTLKMTVPPWAPPQVTTTNSMLNDLSKGVDAIRANHEKCQTKQGCRKTTRTLSDYKDLVNHVMNKYSKTYSIHNDNINAQIDQLRFFDVDQDKKVSINCEKVVAFWPDALISAYAKSLQLRSSALDRYNFEDVYNRYLNFTRCEEAQLSPLFLKLVEFGFERPVKTKYVSCKNPPVIGNAANVIIDIIKYGTPNRNALLTPQRIKRKYTALVRQRPTVKPRATRRLKEQFVYTSPHEEEEGEELTGVAWKYKKPVNDSVRKTMDSMYTNLTPAEIESSIALAAQKPEFSRFVANPRRKISPRNKSKESAKSSDSLSPLRLQPDTMTARALQSIAEPSPENTIEEFAALW
jgi:hypothetical protein